MLLNMIEYNHNKGKDNNVMKSMKFIESSQKTF